MMLFSDMGGIDIEEVAENHPDHVGAATSRTSTPFPTSEPSRSSPRPGLTGRRCTRATPVLARLAGLFSATTT